MRASICASLSEPPQSCRAEFCVTPVNFLPLQQASAFSGVPFWEGGEYFGEQSRPVIEQLPTETGGYLESSSPSLTTSLISR